VSLDMARQAMSTGDWAAARRELHDVPDALLTPEVHELLGQVLWWLGEVRGSLHSRERAFAEYRDRGDREAATMVAVDICVVWLTNLENETAARGWVARARRVAGPTEDAMTGWLDLLEAYLDPTSGREQLERVLASARRHGDRDLELVALADLGLAEAVAGRVSEGMASLDEALAGVIGGDCRRLETFVWTTCNMLAACALTGDLKRATQWCAAADEFMATYGCPFLQARCRGHYGRVLVGCGRWQEAEAELRRALDMAADVGRGPHLEALAALAELRLRQGRAEAAAALLEGVEDPLRVAGTVARVHLAGGRAARAVAVLRDCLEQIGDTGPQSHALSAALVEALLANREPGAASRVAERLERDVVLQGYPQSDALAARGAGLVAAALGDTETARRHLAHAVRLFVALDLPFEAGRTRLNLARAVEPDYPELALSEARTAFDVLTRIGAVTEASAAAALLRRLGERTPPGPRSVEALTERERQVLALLEPGLSNPQIADRLCLSRKTVAHHVSSILAKLDLSSRAEAAAYVARMSRRP
jgi:DNA-binding NarL/FixJ family response regulator